MEQTTTVFIPSTPSTVPPTTGVSTTTLAPTTTPCEKVNLMTDDPIITDAQFDTPNDPSLSGLLDNVRESGDNSKIYADKDVLVITLTGVDNPIKGITVNGDNIQAVRISYQTPDGSQPVNLPVSYFYQFYILKSIQCIKSKQ